MWWKLLSCLDISRLVPGVRLKSFRYASMPRSVPERFARNRSRGGCLSLWEMGVVCPYVQRIVNVWRASAGLSQQVSLALGRIQIGFTCHPCGSSRFPHAAALHQTSLALPVPELHRFTTRSLSIINQTELWKRWRRFLHPSPYTTSTYSAPPHLHATLIRHHLCNYRSTNKIASTPTP